MVHLNSLLTGGGTDDQCVKLAHGLHQLGHTVWLAGPDGREFARVARDLGVPRHLTPAEGPLKLRFILSAARCIRRSRAQIVHGHHGRDIWPTILAARLSGVRPKIVLTRHLAKSPASWFSRRYLLRQCDAVIAVSGFVARVLREGVYEPDSPVAERRARPPVAGDHSRIHVIHGGIDTEQFQPWAGSAMRHEWKLAPEHFAFAAVGAYDLPEGKGQRGFLQAAARIQARVPHARFLIVGRGSLRALLEADIAQLGLQGKAWLTPYCQDMPAAMNALDCLVHGQVGTEAFPGVILEAFACGKPVIASTLDGIPEAFAIGGAGELIAPGDVAALAAAMERAAAGPRLGSAERAALHQAVKERGSVLAMTRSVLSLYRRIHVG